MNIDEYKILINIEVKSYKMQKDFYEKRSVLENKLTKNFLLNDERNKCSSDPDYDKRCRKGRL